MHLITFAPPNLSSLQAVSHTQRSPISAVGPIMIGFLLFLVLGSALFEIIRAVTRGSFSE